MAFTNPFLRKRVAVTNVVTGGNRGFQQQSPQGSPISGDQLVGGLGTTPLYQYHEGDLFTPGTGNWVFELNLELPMVTIWGNAFLRTPNTFNPYQPPPLIMQPTVVQAGIGGLQAGGIQFTPLQVDEY
jgi:hypothetical protein